MAVWAFAIFAERKLISRNENMVVARKPTQGHNEMPTKDHADLWTYIHTTDRITAQLYVARMANRFSPRN